MRNQLKSVWVLSNNYKLNLYFEIKLIGKNILKIMKFLKKTKQNVLLRLEKSTLWTYYKKTEDWWPVRWLYFKLFLWEEPRTDSRVGHGESESQLAKRLLSVRMFTACPWRQLTPRIRNKHSFGFQPVPM